MEPIHAGVPTWLERLHKYTRRHRAGVMAASVVSIVFVFGVAVSATGWFFAREQMELARQAKLEAQMHAARSQSLSRFLQQVLTAVNPQQAAQLVRDARVVVASVPEVAQAQTMLGIAHFRAGRFHEARQTLDEADRRSADLSGGVPSALAFLAMSHFAIGETKRAHQVLARAQALMRAPRWAGEADDQRVINEARQFLATYENPLFLDHTDGCPIDT